MNFLKYFTAVEVTFSEAEVVNGVQHIGFARTIFTGKEINGGWKMEFRFPVVFKMVENKVIKIHGLQKIASFEFAFLIIFAP